MNVPKETITVKWSMDERSWNHWAVGRGDRTVSDVILDGIRAIRKRQDALERIRNRITNQVIPEERESTGVDSGDLPRIAVKLNLPAAEWGAACRRVAKPDGEEPVRPTQLLAAIILESESWKQGDRGSSDSGWHRESLISSLALSTELTNIQSINLEREEKWLARLLVVAAAIGTLAGIASAVVAFLGLQAS